MHSGNPAAASDGADDHGSRLDRIESLLKRLVQSQEGHQAVAISTQTQPAMSGGVFDGALFDGLGDFNVPSTVSAYSQEYRYSITPATYPNNVTEFGVSSSGHMTTDTAKFGIGNIGNTPMADFDALTTTVPGIQEDSEKSLVTLLPSPQDAVTITMNTFAWLWGAETPPGGVFRPDDTAQLLDLATISKGSPIQVAKMLLLFALYMQQLPDDFDESLLGFEDVSRTIDLIVGRSKAYIMTHEDEACSIDGIESLLVLSTIYLNSGDIRKTWSTFRRTVDMAKLAGLQQSFSAAKRNSQSDEDALLRRLWLSAACGDSYCSLLLGQEPATGSEVFGAAHETWIDPVAEKEANVQRLLCGVMAKLTERNAKGLHLDEGITRELEDRLSTIYNSLPVTWWDTPTFPPGRSLDSAQEPTRLLCQMWYFMTQMFVQLPLAFGPHRETAYYDLKECRNAGRNTLSRHLGSQHAKEQLARCRGGEQAAFLSAVVLLMCIVQSRVQFVHVPREKKEKPLAMSFDLDRTLVQQTIASFEARGKSGRREQISKQCAEILSKMRDFAFREDFIETTVKEAVGKHNLERLEMEKLIDSAIRPSLSSSTPAARLLDLTFDIDSTIPMPPEWNSSLAPFSPESWGSHSVTGYPSGKRPSRSSEQLPPLLGDTIIEND